MALDGPYSLSRSHCHLQPAAAVVCWLCCRTFCVFTVHLQYISAMQRTGVTCLCLAVRVHHFMCISKHGYTLSRLASLHDMYSHIACRSPYLTGRSTSTGVGLQCSSGSRTCIDTVVALPTCYNCPQHTRLALAWNAHVQRSPAMSEFSAMVVVLSILLWSLCCC